MKCLYDEYNENIFITAVTYVKFDQICLRYFNLKQNKTCDTEKK